MVSLLLVYDTYEAVPSQYYNVKVEEEEEETQYPNPDGGGKYKHFVRTIRKRQRPTTRRHKRSSHTSRRRYRKK